MVLEALTPIILRLGGWKYLASYLLLLPPFLAVLSGSVVSWIVARRNVYINSITVERSKWLEKLRSSISEFQAAIEVFNHSATVIHKYPQFDNQPQVETLAEMNRISRLAYTIQLQLNPEGVVDKNIIALVRALSFHRYGRGAHISAGIDLLTQHSQFLLKDEWEKVKREAGGAPLNFLRDKRLAKRRLGLYEDFLKQSGNPVPVINEIVFHKDG